MSLIEKIEEIQQISEDSLIFAEQRIYENVNIYEQVKELDYLISSINDADIENIADEDLERICLKLPSIIYYLSSKGEIIGVQCDQAIQLRKSYFLQEFSKANGNMTEKKQIAEEKVKEYTIAEQIYKRAYTLLQTKIDVAEQMHSAVKKILTKRMSEREFSKRDTNA